MNPCTAIVYNQTSNNTVDGSLQAADNPAHDSPDGLFAIMVKEGTTETMYYVHKDYLGSISAITDASGNLVESLSYDPWGRRRNPSDWTDYNISSTLFDRGFTGHEHLPHFGLINMNGRVYDPFLARFLSPDPFIQAPTYTQNYNRYSYAWNNPLKFFDPSGYINQYPDEGGIPTRHRDGGSTSATFAPGSFANNWYAWATNPTAMTARHHHFNAHRTEGMNALYLSASAYNSIYGQGASRVDYDVWQDPDARAQWLSGQISLQNGFWVQYTRQEGEAKWFGFSSSRNRLAGVEVINKFVKFNRTSGKVDRNNSLFEYAGYGLTGGNHCAITLNEAAIGVSAISLTNSLKGSLVEWGMKGVDWGKTGTRYIKVVRGAGIAGTVFGIGISGYNIYTDYTQGGINAVNGWDAADFGIGAAGLGATIFLASNPVGWVIAGGATIYFGARFVYDISTKP